jgi:hypothetical protein
MTTDSFGKRHWVELFREIGLDEGQMRRWHAAFEQRYPDAHQSFLDWLNVTDADATRIRDASRTDWARG